MKLLFISHSLGGGIELHIKNKSHLFSQGVEFQMISPRQNALELSRYSPSSHEFVKVELIAEPSRLIEILNKELNVEIHSLVGWPTWAITAIALSSIENLVFYFHDYSLFRENEHLLINDAGYWDPQLYQIKNSFISIIISKSKFLVAPSIDCANRISVVLGREVTKVVFEELCVHDVKRTKLVHRFTKNNIVLVPGHIAKQKGSDLFQRVLEMSEVIAPNTIYFVAGSDHTRSIKNQNAFFFGGYNQGELNSIAIELSINTCWWPTNGSETFSYTFSEMLNSECRLIVPLRGAFIERSSKFQHVELVEDPDDPISQLNAILMGDTMTNPDLNIKESVIPEYNFGLVFGLEEHCARS